MASGSRSINQGSDGLFQNECDVCLTQGITSEGISHCTVCNENLCQRCEQSHRGSRATRDHTIMTGSVVTPGPIQTTPHVAFTFCDTHKQSLLNAFCKVHNEMLCITCKATHHKKCDTVDVSRQVKAVNVAGEFKAVVKSVSDITDRFNNLQQTRQADKTSLKGQIQTCLNDLQKIRKDTNDKLDALENKMAAEIRQFETKIAKEIDDHHALIKSVLVQIDDLKKSLKGCQKSHDDDVMFIGMKKASLRKTEFEKIIDSIQEDIYPIDIRIEPNDILTDLMDQLQTIGTLVTGKQTGHSRSAPTSVPTSVPNKAGLVKQVSKRRSSPNSLLNIEVTGKREEIDLKSSFPQGCVFMGDGHLVVACTDRLELYDKDCRYKSKLDIESYDVAIIDDYTVIVKQGYQLQYVQVLPDMKVVRTVTMDIRCFGVDVCGDELYVTGYDYIRGNGKVQVLTMDGKVLRTLGGDKGKYRFTLPYYVKVSKTGDKVFVSDCYTDTITCLSTQGRTLYKYTDTDLKVPLGMYVDETDNLLVCGEKSGNIHVVRHDGTRDRILLTEKDGIKYPRAISYRPTDGCLAVVREKPSRLLTFSTKI